MNFFLRDWRPGDPIQAADLQDVVNAIRLLESVNSSTPGLAHPPGRAVDTDGPVEHPWLVYLDTSQPAPRLRVIPGSVLIGYGVQEPGAAPAFQYLDLPEGADIVEGFRPGIQQAVYLELTGSVAATALSQDDMPADFTLTGMLQHTELREPRLRVTCNPSATALRLWYLAMFTPSHSQPVNQLLWGDLSALECTAICDTLGAPVTPAARTGSRAWGVRGHEADMEVLSRVDFSTPVETIRGALYGALDEDGAMEIYLGPVPDPLTDNDEPPPPIPWDDPEEDDDWPPFIPPGPITPVPPTPPGPTPGPRTRVRYGYIAGQGFLSCDLVRDAQGHLWWQLDLDPDFLATTCSGLSARGTLTVNGDGNATGTVASVEMGLGACTASATGTAITGTAALLFHATNAVDVSKKTDSITYTLTISPSWTQPRTWYLSPDTLHQAGRFVKLQQAPASAAPFGYSALHWYRFSVNAKAFRAGARKHLKSRMAATSLNASGTATSYDAQVAASLSGTLAAPVLTFTLS